MPEPSHMAGVIPTRRLSRSAMSHSHRPNTSWYLGPLGLDETAAGWGPFGLASILLMA